MGTSEDPPQRNELEAYSAGGNGSAARGYIDRIMDNPEWGYHVLGILDDTMDRQAVYRGIRIIGRTDDLEQLLKEHQLDEITLHWG